MHTVHDLEVVSAEIFGYVNKIVRLIDNGPKIQDHKCLSVSLGYVDRGLVYVVALALLVLVFALDLLANHDSRRRDFSNRTELITKQYYGVGFHLAPSHFMPLFQSTNSAEAVPLVSQRGGGGENGGGGSVICVRTCDFRRLN